MGKLITEKEYEIHYYEVDYKKRALLSSIVDYFSDIASKQSEERNVGLEYMEKNKIAWVLYKWHIEVDRYPLYGEKVKVRTIPYSYKKFYAYRTFDVIDKDGNVLIHAKSVWLLIDTEKRKPKTIDETMQAAYYNPEDKNKVLEIPKIIHPKNKELEKTFNVRYSDIDTNGHVNNVKYVSWVIETVPLQVVKNYLLKSITITYEKETKYGEIINASTEVIEEKDKILCRHIIVDKEGRRLTIAETIWQ